MQDHLPSQPLPYNIACARLRQIRRVLAQAKVNTLGIGCAVRGWGLVGGILAGRAARYRATLTRRRLGFISVPRTAEDFTKNFGFIMPQIPENLSAFDTIFKAFEQSVSKPRLKPYRKIATGKVEAIALYLWNIALCEALYPSFYGFETALRSATYDALFSINGDRFWYEDPLLLAERHQLQVVEARSRLEQKRLNAHEPHRVVAELSLGFWVNLFSDPYTNSVFIPIAEAVFPGAPKPKRMQGVLYPLLHEALDFRNRVFHHEPIHTWPDLLEKHARVNTLFEWISPVHRSFLRSVDRFSEVHLNGWSAYHDAAWFTFMREEEVVIHGSGVNPKK